MPQAILGYSLGAAEPSDYADTGESGEAYDIDKGYENFRRRWKVGDEEAISEIRWLSQILR